MADALVGTDDTKLRRAFLEEAEEMVGHLNRRLVELEQDTANADLVNEIFRLVHSLKSEAALMGFSRLSEVAHRTEDVFDQLKSGRLELERPVMDGVFAATDLINEMIARISSGGGDADFLVAPVLQELDAAMGRKGAPAARPTQPARAVIQAEQKADLTRADRAALEESRARRERLYRITCELEESCTMKFPRAYLMQSNLESVATVIRTVPSLEMPADGAEIVDEEFARFVVYLSTNGVDADLAHALDVDEVRRFEIVPLDYEDILAAPQAPAAGVTPRQEGRPKPSERTSIRVETKKLDDIWSLVGQLVITKGRLGRLAEHVASQDGELREDIGALGDDIGNIAEGLQRAMMDTRMVPISVLFDKLPRLIRDLSKHIGKEADLVTRGETTEIDRSFVEALSDPLTHLIRNCLDHGLELPEERLRAGKPERGRITATAFQEGGKVVIEVSDDGRGLDLDRIRRKGEQMGLVRPGDVLTDSQVVELIFRPGFSTAQAITDISGRGVGMDVVATRVREVLRGEVLVRSDRGGGTRFSIVLPLTLTILNTLIVGLGGRQYAIPIANVDETAKLPERSVQRREGGLVAPHRGEEIAVVFLADLLGVPRNTLEVFDTVIVTHRGKKAYLVVDQLIEETDVVIKPVDDVVNPGRLFSGVSVLGDGRILLILSTTFIGD